ncbi:MAG: hypothetical protein IJ189_11375 [Clostridia bacterium]|nr:hypothetical protein [Clostridia bacterium]
MKKKEKNPLFSLLIVILMLLLLLGIALLAVGVKNGPFWFYLPRGESI